MPVLADAPSDAVAIGPAAALDCVAGRYHGEALRIRDDEGPGTRGPLADACRKCSSD
jgi:hypothetical protein